MIMDPYVMVMCDRKGCLAQAEVPLTATGGYESYDMRNVRHHLNRDGWQVDGDTTYCPDCVEEGKVPK